MPRGHHQPAPADLLHRPARELKHLRLGQRIELAVAIGQQRDPATAGDADLDGVADALLIQRAIGAERGGNRVDGALQEERGFRRGIWVWALELLSSSWR